MSLFDHNDRLSSLISKTLTNIYKSNNIQGGFTFIYLDSKAEVKSRFIPFNKSYTDKIVKDNLKHFELGNIDIYQHLGKERSYKATFHYHQTISGQLLSENHFFLNINKKTIDKIVKNFPNISINDQLLNDLDLLHFDLSNLIERGSVEILKIPICYLSATVGLIYLTKPESKEDTYGLINKINELLREYIYTYINIELLNSVYNKTEGIKNDDKEFIRVYASEISKYLLPRSCKIRCQGLTEDIKNGCTDGYKGDVGVKIKIATKLSSESSELIEIIFNNIHFPERNNEGIFEFKPLHKTYYNHNIIDRSILIFQEIFKLTYLQWKRQNEAKQAALQSAVSQIFARNYAHNIGSHVKINAGLVKQVERVNELYKNEGDAGYDPMRLKSVKLAKGLLEEIQSSKKKKNVALEVLEVLENYIINENISKLDDLAELLEKDQSEYIKYLINDVKKDFDIIKKTYEGEQEILQVIENYIINENISNLKNLPGELTKEQKRYVENLISDSKKEFEIIQKSYEGEQEILQVVENYIIKENVSNLKKLPGVLTKEQGEYLKDLLDNIEFKFERIRRTYGGERKIDIYDSIRERLTAFITENRILGGTNVENILGILTYHKNMLDEYEIQRNEFISNPKMPTLNKKLFKEVLAPFTENTLLMDNLCKSEGVCYQKVEKTSVNNLKIHFLFSPKGTVEKYPIKIAYPKLKCVNRIEEGNDKSDIVENHNIEYPNHFPYLTDTKEKTENKSLNEYIEILKASFREKVLQFKQESSSNSSWKPFNDVEVALPGAHPLYSILENFIRNSSKHNRKKIKEEKDGELHIFIDIREEESSYRILLYDNVSDLSDHKLIKMHESLKTSLLDEEQDYQPKNSNLGMFDKRINAHLLQSSDEITNENLRKSLVLYHFKRENGICHNEEEVNDKFIEGIRNKAEEREKSNAIDESSHSIALSFHIAKAKKVCWIGFQTGITEDERKNLKKEGVYFFEDISSYKEFSKKEKISVAAWEFAVLSSETLIEDKFFSMDGDNNEDSIAQNFESFAMDLPFRILIDTDYNDKEDSGSKVNKVLKLLTGRRRVQPTTRRFDFAAILKNEKGRANNDYLNANYMLEWCWQNWLMRWTKDEQPGQEYCDVTLAVFPDIVSGTGKRENIWESIQEELEKVSGEGAANLFEMGNISFQLETNPSSIKDITDNQKIIMYDQHGRWSKSQSDKHLIESDMEKIIRNGFYEVFSKNSEDFVHIFYPPEGSFERKIFCYQLIEAGLCKVSVMDERLNAYMFKNTYANSDDHLLKESDINNLRNCDYADAANLVQLDGTNQESILKQGTDRTNSTDRKTKNTSVRGILVGEGREGLSSNKQKIEGGLAEAFGKNYTQSDVLIIHRTFLKSEMWSEKEISCDKILNILRKYYPFVIVISGGGNPNIEGAYKYKPYNLYKDLFGDQVNKWSVVRYSMV